MRRDPLSLTVYDLLSARNVLHMAPSVTFHDLSEFREDETKDWEIEISRFGMAGLYSWNSVRFSSAYFRVIVIVFQMHQAATAAAMTARATCPFCFVSSPKNA